MKTKRGFFEYRYRMMPLPSGSVVVTPEVADRILNVDLISILRDSSVDWQEDGYEEAGKMLGQLADDLQTIRAEHE